MDIWVNAAVTVLCSLIASGGFWTIVQKKVNKKDNLEKLVLGLAHDKIKTLGLQYIERGYMTEDEFSDIHKYLCDPYLASGGDGSAEKIMKEVDKLPFRKA